MCICMLIFLNDCKLPLPKWLFANTEPLLARNRCTFSTAAALVAPRCSRRKSRLRRCRKARRVTAPAPMLPSWATLGMTWIYLATNNGFLEFACHCYIQSWPYGVYKWVKLWKKKRGTADTSLMTNNDHVPTTTPIFRPNSIKISLKILVLSCPLSRL